MSSKLYCFACTIIGKEEIEERYGLCNKCKGMSSNEVNILRLITMQVVPHFLWCYTSEIKEGKLKERLKELIKQYPQYELGGEKIKE